jgi:dihydroneopterin aldolase
VIKNYSLLSNSLPFGEPRGKLNYLFIHNLQIETLIGILPWEQTTKQTLTIDLDLGVDIHTASSSSNIQDAVDYSAVAQRVTDFVKQNQFQLLEAAAEKIADLLLQEFKIQWLRLQITKHNAIPNAKDVGIVIERNSKLPY